MTISISRKTVSVFGVTRAAVIGMVSCFALEAHGTSFNHHFIAPRCLANSALKAASLSRTYFW